MASDDDQTIRHALETARTIALVGASAKPERPAHYVGQFLTEMGHKVIPVNPGLEGQTLFGQTVRAQLSDIAEPVDMIDIFRKVEAVPQIVAEALEAFPNLKTIWMQLGITHADATALAEARGVTVIQDRCPKIEYPRLMAV